MSRKLALLTAVITIFSQWAFSQADTGEDGSEISLDLLRGSFSPASTMLGIGESQIERPTDPAGFMTSIRQATDNFSVIPMDYAVDLAPAWLLAGKKITIDDYLSDRPGKAFPQSLVVSLATKTVGAEGTDTMVTQFATGLKFSIFRGKPSEKTMDQLEKLHEQLYLLTSAFDSLLTVLLENNDEYVTLDRMTRDIMLDTALSFDMRKQMTSVLRKRMDIIADSTGRAAQEELSDLYFATRNSVESLKIVRYGFKLDLAGGLVWSFPQLNFDQGVMDHFALWMVSGWEGPKGFGVFGRVRYNLYPRQLIVGENNNDLTSLNSIDVGLRASYYHPDSKFFFSLEGLWMSYFGDEVPDPSTTWRFDLNAGYEIGRNKRLALAFGKDFNNLYNGQAGLIVGLNLVLGFGTTRNL